MTTHRKEKLEELIRRVVAEALLKDIKDPRIGFTTVTRVKLAKDYSVADVFISVMGAEDEVKKSMAGLESAKSYMQFIVGREVRLRSTPKIKFHLDRSIEEGVRMVDVIDKLTGETTVHENDDNDENDENDRGDSR